MTAATYVPVDLIINFCVKAGFRSADVQQRIEQALSNSVLTGGTEGFSIPTISLLAIRSLSAAFMRR